MSLRGDFLCLFADHDLNHLHSPCGYILSLLTHPNDGLDLLEIPAIFL